MRISNDNAQLVNHSKSFSIYIKFDMQDSLMRKHLETILARAYTLVHLEYVVRVNDFLARDIASAN